MSSVADLDEATNHAIRTCKTNQSMIDFTAKQLNGLRIECATTEEITQTEIKDTEVSSFFNVLILY